MGTLYFLLLVGSCLLGSFLILRRVNSSSYLYGEKKDATDLDALREAYRKNKIEHPRVEAYIDWYTKKFEAEESKTESRTNLGTAYAANDAAGGSAGQNYRAVH